MRWHILTPNEKSDQNISNKRNEILEQLQELDKEAMSNMIEKLYESTQQFRKEWLSNEDCVLSINLEKQLESD